MGVTQRLGTIPLAIFTDASNNVGIGGSPSGSYKFEVTGTGRFTDTLNIIANNSTAYSLNLFGRTLDNATTLNFYSNNGATRYGFIYTEPTNMQIGVNSAVRMTIASSGNVGIGTSSPLREMVLYRSSGEVHFKLANGTTGQGTTDGFDMAIDGSGGAYLINRENQPMYFLTNGVERLRIGTTGQLKITANVGDDVLRIDNNYSPVPYGININFPGASPNSTSTYFFNAADSTNTKAVIYSNGTYASRTNTYGSISDIRLKENITPATSKLDDLLKVNIVNYNMIDDEKKEKQLGVISQELELIFPNMIFEAEDKITGETHKHVKYSIFVPMLIKAIQELNAKVSALENKS
jgi:hypothetical protein